MRKSGCFLGFVLGLAAAFGQTAPIQPDCQFRQYLFTGTTTTVPVNNVNQGCVVWIVEYQAEGFSSINLIFEAAPAVNLNTTIVPGTFATWAGTVVNGVNPQIVSPGTGATRFSDASAAATAGFYGSFVRLNLSAVGGGPGNVIATLYGYKAGNAAAAAASLVVPCAGTAASPCVVDGPNAAGVAPTKPPVLLAGQDGAPGNVRTLQTDASGRPIVVGAAAAGTAIAGNPVLTGGSDGANARALSVDTSGRTIEVGAAAAGAAIAGNPVLTGGSDGTNARALSVDTAGETIPANTSAAAAAAGVSNTAALPAGAAGAALMARSLPYLYNGSTLDSQFGCTNQAAFSLSAATDVVVVAGVASTNTRLCYFNFGGDSAHTITVRQGTGTTCLSNTATIAGPYSNVSAFDFPFLNNATLRTTVAARDICLHFDASVTGGGVAIYATF